MFTALFLTFSRYCGHTSNQTSSHPSKNSVWIVPSRRITIFFPASVRSSSPRVKCIMDNNSKLNLHEFTRIAGSLLQLRCPYAAWIPNTTLLVVGLTWRDRHDWMMVSIQNIQAVHAVCEISHARSNHSATYFLFLLSVPFPVRLVWSPVLPLCVSPVSHCPSCFRDLDRGSPTLHLLFPLHLTFTVSTTLLSFGLLPQL